MRIIVSALEEIGRSVRPDFGDKAVRCVSRLQLSPEFAQSGDER